MEVRLLTLVHVSSRFKHVSKVTRVARVSSVLPMSKKLEITISELAEKIYIFNLPEIDFSGNRNSNPSLIIVKIAALERHFVAFSFVNSLFSI